MFSSELIVGLWFVPVVLSIIIPLSMFCVWSAHKLVAKIIARIERASRSAQEARDESYVQALRLRHAV